MSEPKSGEHVIAHKQASAGRVTVHAWRNPQLPSDMTDCGFTAFGDWAWLWVEYRTLNPEKIALCKKCWVSS